MTSYTFNQPIHAVRSARFTVGRRTHAYLALPGIRLMESITRLKNVKKIRDARGHREVEEALAAVQSLLLPPTVAMGRWEGLKNATTAIRSTRMVVPTIVRTSVAMAFSMERRNVTTGTILINGRMN